MGKPGDQEMMINKNARRQKTYDLVPVIIFSKDIISPRLLNTI
jgi:hypothetical protein